MKNTIKVKKTKISIVSKNDEEYISLTDLARYKNPEEPKDVVKNWLRNKSTIEFLGLWEKINNPVFKGVEFDAFMKEAGTNSFVLSPKKWIEKTNSKGLISKSGKGGGTYAHKDIAFEFASWISSEFKLYLIKEFQRLKIKESERARIGWDIKRELTKINYRIHTDAIKQNLIPKKITKKQEKQIYSSEADVLNVALFGITAKEWRHKNKDKKGNVRDNANVSQLVCLANLETLNSLFIKEKLPQQERLTKLNEQAIAQMTILINNRSIKKLEKLSTHNK
ncbi:KilA-N domain-containing protein [Candidatus Woesearchaeota archaeon]|jgi:hypothetical protein|nr:KilA-N domain-containing protein [Candidatus Woesearchaeota archaeon]MBT6518826.1 KilA-N domain-containing protein [Candidatus Woesearchaeota archaeon]MBT7367965.1 KilA-N domain-containing protein [Candidatus Woesearchaeota archaeon]